jgi:hypothetical protein
VDLARSLRTGAVLVLFADGRAFTFLPSHRRHPALGSYADVTYADHVNGRRSCSARRTDHSLGDHPPHRQVHAAQAFA